MQTRALMGIGTTAVVVLGLALAAVRAPAQEGSAVKQGAPTTTLKRLGKAPDPVQRLQTQVDDLKLELAAQKDVIAKLEHKLNQSTTQPPGYATTFTTKTNWERLPGNTLLKVWMRE